MNTASPSPESQAASDPSTIVAALVKRARRAQQSYEQNIQTQVDEVVTAVAWALVEPARNRELSELAVATTGLGNVTDKEIKNRRKTMGLLRDLHGAPSVGVIAEYPELGLTEIARPVGVVGAVVPSTNPVATPTNKILNALKGRNAIILAPSPKGQEVCAKLLEYIHTELDRVGALRDLVQQLPDPVSKETTRELMRQADLIVATGSQNNVRAAYSSGTPAIGVGVGNVPVIVDQSADLADAAGKIAASKCFDNATSCSAENSLIVTEAQYDAAIAALAAKGGVLLDAGEKGRLQAVMWSKGKLSREIVARSAPEIACIAGLDRGALDTARFLIVEEDEIGPDHPFSGEKLSPVLAVYRATDFEAAVRITRRLLEHQGKGHSVGIHSHDDAHIQRLALELPVCRVIVNQAHCYATGGSFDNGLPFSLSMGCGTWGGNSISENLNYRHYLNITRIARIIDPDEPTEEALFGAYRAKFGLKD